MDDYGDDLEEGPQDITIPVVTDGVPRAGNPPLLARFDVALFLARFTLRLDIPLGSCYG
jgi:hypothetical protein